MYVPKDIGPVALMVSRSIFSIGVTALLWVTYDRRERGVELTGSTTECTLHVEHTDSGVPVVVRSAKDRQETREARAAGRNMALTLV